MNNIQIDSLYPTNITRFSSRQPEIVKKQLLSFLSLVICAIGFLYCLLISITPITRLAWTQPQSWIQHKLLAFGRWLPDNWHVAANYAISHQHTGYMQLMIFMAFAFIAYILCAFFINILESTFKRFLPLRKLRSSLRHSSCQSILCSTLCLS